MSQYGKEYFSFSGVKISNIDYEGICNTIAQNVHSSGYICVTCVHTIIEALRDKIIMEATNHSLLSIADGTPLAWYGRLLGYRTVRRITGPTLLKRLLEEENDYKHFLLGDTERTIARVIETAKDSKENIRITGYSPPFKPEFSSDDNDRTIARIRRENPDLIWVSFGMAKQAKWMYENIHKFDRGIMIGVGAAFKFYIGQILTPPKIIQHLGLHWFFRMLEDPIRIGKSQLLTFPKFIALFPYELIKARKRIKLG